MKQTLLEIRRKTNVTTQAIAECAMLPKALVFVVETGGFTSRENAQKVVNAFNQLSGMKIVLENIKYTDVHGSLETFRGYGKPENGSAGQGFNLSTNRHTDVRAR